MASIEENVDFGFKTLLLSFLENFKIYGEQYCEIYSKIENIKFDSNLDEVFQKSFEKSESIVELNIFKDIKVSEVYEKMEIEKKMEVDSKFFMLKNYNLLSKTLNSENLTDFFGGSKSDIDVNFESLMEKAFLYIKDSKLVDGTSFEKKINTIKEKIMTLETYILIKNIKIDNETDFISDAKKIVSKIMEEFSGPIDEFKEIICDTKDPMKIASQLKKFVNSKTFKECFVSVREEMKELENLCKNVLPKDITENESAKLIFKNDIHEIINICKNEFKLGDNPLVNSFVNTALKTLGYKNEPKVLTKEEKMKKDKRQRHKYRKEARMKRKKEKKNSSQ